MMSSPSWLTSLECSTAIIPSTESSSLVSKAILWLQFIFLSPCSQRALFSAIDLLFLFVLIVLAVRKLCSRFFTDNDSGSSIDKPLLEGQRPRFAATLWFKLPLVATAILGVYYVVVCVLAFTGSAHSRWYYVESLFRLFQAVTQVAILVLVAHEKKFGAVSHPASLRIYWVVSMVLVALFAAAGVTRIITVGKKMDPDVRIDDIFSIASLPVYAFLFIVAIRGSSGIKVVKEPRDCGDSRAVVRDSTDEIDFNISAYARASFFSKATWYWVNPLMSKGYQSPLKVDDVPKLPMELGAEALTEFMGKKWPTPGEEVSHAVRNTLLRCFWPELCTTGLLSLLRVLVQYTGPILIQSFIDFAKGGRKSPSEGFFLVFVLMLSKTVEVLSSHHFNFQAQQLGMRMRAALVGGLFKKGLKLSSSSRQEHGIGQIVNYMVVDTQQISDMMPQLHSIWMMPLQIGISLVLLYGYVGLSMFVSLFAILAVMVLTGWITFKNGVYQFNLSSSRDSRMKTTTEALNNMRVIKFQAWEEHFKNRILHFRGMEFKWLGKFMYLLSGNMILLWSIPLLISALTFAAAALSDVNVTASSVFTITTILRILQEPIRTFPQALISISQAVVSLNRLDRFMTSKELDLKSVEREEGCNGKTAVEVKDGVFSWEDEGEVTLKGINFKIKKGELAAIVGTVGSGKSSLLAAVLGELHKFSGKVRVCGTTAYVSQTSWIRNATIQENILFGSPLDIEKYKKVLKACSLEKDMEIFEYGDQTEIGERGINLSGGQKQRIQLARAVYQDCDVYLLDDVFSAVDAHTGTEIFKECVRGALKDKTILLVTHQVDFLHNADLIMVMRDGEIVQSGKYKELLESGMDFGALVAAHENSIGLVENSTQVSGGTSMETPLSPHSPTPLSPQNLYGGEFAGRSMSTDETKSVVVNSKLIEEEERETGQISFDVYKQYCTEAYGWLGVVVVLVTSILWQCSQMASDYWMAYETSGDHFNRFTFIAIYSAIAGVSCIFVAARTVVVTAISLKTCQSFFKQLLYSTLHAPMAFFDTTPSGRILSRVSIDQTNVDFVIPMFLSITLTMYFSVFGILFITCQNSWPTTIFLIPLGWLNFWYRRYFIATSRELTRLESITKAPVVDLFNEAISGVMTIRCFRKKEEFFQENFNRLNSSNRMTFHNYSAIEWLGFRLELIGCLLLGLATGFMVFLPRGFVNPEYVGLTLSYGLILNSGLFFAVYMSCIVENRMVSVERLKQFIKIPSEAPWHLTECTPSQDWPTRGDIRVNNLKVRYRPNTPLVLKGISLHIHGGEKIGVVGRTGSGKSTLIQVFFRLVEPCGGNIIIDGIDICKVGLHDVRARFGIIPQDPVLFEGTIRTNIDPLGVYSDDEIWKSLERCQLKDVVAAKPEKLDAIVADAGENFSVGQRQLLCLGRVLLKRSRILFMDEATASVDSQTDALIQGIIREDFFDSTIITIAHRIPSVIDADRALVVDDGWVKEFDKPSRLLERPTIFAALVKEYSKRSTDM